VALIQYTFTHKQYTEYIIYIAYPQSLRIIILTIISRYAQCMAVEGRLKSVLQCQSFPRNIGAMLLDISTTNCMF